MFLFDIHIHIYIYTYLYFFIYVYIYIYIYIFYWQQNYIRICDDVFMFQTSYEHLLSAPLRTPLQAPLKSRSKQARAHASSCCSGGAAARISRVFVKEVVVVFVKIFENRVIYLSSLYKCFHLIFIYIHIYIYIYIVSI